MSESTNTLKRSVLWMVDDDNDDDDDDMMMISNISFCSRDI